MNDHAPHECYSSGSTTAHHDPTTVSNCEKLNFEPNLWKVSRNYTCVPFSLLVIDNQTNVTVHPQSECYVLKGNGTLSTQLCFVF